MSSSSDDTDYILDWWDPMLQHYLRIRGRGEFSLFPSEPKSIKWGDNEVCGQHFIHGWCPDGEYCTKLHLNEGQKVEFLQFEREMVKRQAQRSLWGTKINDRPFEPKPSALLMASITQINSPTDFHVFLPYEQTDLTNKSQEELKVYLDDLDSSPNQQKVDLISCELAEMFKHPINYEDDADNQVYPSQIVACKLDDGKHCRAKLIKISIDDDDFVYEVQLIDLGFEVKLKRESIFAVMFNLLEEDPMAIHCSLPVAPVDPGSGWSDEGLGFFKEMTSQRNLLCRLIDFDTRDRQYIVDLFDINTQSSLSEQLVSRKMATRRKV